MSSRRPSRQPDDSSPFIEDARLPEMASDVSAVSAKRKGPTMSEEPRADRGGKGRMKPVPKVQRPARETAAGFKDQVRAKPKIARSRGESYIRLHFHVEDSQVSLVGVHEVEGPLAMPKELYGEIAYELAVGPARIGMGSVADAGVIRGYPRPDADPSKEGHSIIELPSYDFFARVPKKALSVRDLRRLDVSVFRIKSQPEKPIDPRPLAAQFGDNLRQVARLEGIAVDKLPAKLKRQVRRAIG